MALVLKGIYKTCVFYTVECRDHRIEHYPLNGTPLVVVGLIGSYLLFIKKIGPEIMKNRKPFELNGFMMVYNLLQVIANVILGVYSYYWSYANHYKFACQYTDYTTSEMGLLEARLTYCYYILKVSDLLDTVFMVLRKKNSHVTFLHVYHHIGMVGVTYVSANYIPGGHAALLGIINMFVHTVMYFYYFLTAFKPELKKSIWWKKHITQIQMLQFAILIIHFARALFTKDCQYPKVWSTMGVIQNTFMFVLFGDFYLRAYKKGKKHES